MKPNRFVKGMVVIGVLLATQRRFCRTGCHRPFACHLFRKDKEIRFWRRRVNEFQALVQKLSDLIEEDVEVVGTAVGWDMR